MTVELDIRTLELVCSRICHELVSPVGAINNGVELIEDIAGAAGEGVSEALQLIAASADQATRRLRLLRLAYGAAGTESSATERDFRATAAHYFQDGRVALDWPDRVGGLALTQPGAGKLLLNLLMLAEEALPYGGVIHVGDEELPSVVAEGRGVALRSEVSAALTGASNADGLTARSIHGFVTRCFAARAGLRVVVTPQGMARLGIELGR
ncbi:MAG: histidine phosphotransferase family protein [Azospirillaceae bacterium]|nr:histidine phosphotransferase family protein [Azospirillaceae bacterium]